MGEVYKAKDQNLGWDVAIKVLPEELAKDTDRIARFQREDVGDILVSVIKATPTDHVVRGFL